MLRFSDGLEVEVLTEVDANASEVWEVITDLNLSAKFSDEFLGAEWIDDGPVLGAAFKGQNQRGPYEWETTSWVSSYEPMVSFGWAVSDPDDPGASWTFHLEPSDDGTKLRFHRLLGPGKSGITAMIAREPEREDEFLSRRDEEHRQSMQAVVDGVKKIVESGK